MVFIASNFLNSDSDETTWEFEENEFILPLILWMCWLNAQTQIDSRPFSRRKKQNLL